MNKETKFSALACSSCEQTKPNNDVVWKLVYRRYKGARLREVGFMSGKEIDVYTNEGRIRKSLSSSTCPQCAADKLTNGSIEDLRVKWSTAEPRWLYENTDRWINRYLAFKQKNERKE